MNFFQLNKTEYPNGIPDNESYMVVPNGGGKGATDWINPTGGVAAGWLNVLGTPSISTGNGFTGNAQKLTRTGTTVNAGLLAEFSSITLEVGKVYTVSFMYRSNGNFRMFSWVDESSNIVVVPTNTGNATLFTFTGHLTTLYEFRFQMYANQSTATEFEVDEINIVEKPLVAYYPFDGNLNEIINGSSGTAIPNLATILTTGRQGGANKGLYFNGTTSYVNLGNPTELDTLITSGSWNTVFWCKIPSDQLGSLSKGVKQVGSLYYGFYIFITDTTIGVRRSTGTTSSYTHSVPHNKDVGDVAFISINYNKTSGEFKFYCNCNYLGSVTTSTSDVVFGGSMPIDGYLLGRQNFFEFQNYVEGYLYDLKVYNRELTSTELHALWRELDF